MKWKSLGNLEPEGTQQQRAAAGSLAEQYKVSKVSRKRVGRVIGRSRSTLRYDR